ncbi:unnamed protein product, partial [Vitis vinifera]
MLGKCKELQQLNLFNNKLVGSIPEAICNLSKLEELYLGNNQLTGEIPNKMSHLHNLKVLSFPMNNLTGSIPATIFNISSLLNISLSYNSLSESLPMDMCYDNSLNVLKSNRLSVMYIKTKISAGIRGSIEQHENVCELLKAIDKQFVTLDKALASTLIMKFTSLKLTAIKGVREHIMEMRDIVAQLKKLEVKMSESFLVHFILNTLPPQYGPFKISYNTHKDKWSINELMTMCVQEEGRLMMEQGESVMLVTQRKGKKGKSQASQKGKQQISPKSDIKKDEKCFFCKKKGHVKKKCLKFQNWLEKKGNPTSFICYESNMVNVNTNTWWIDSGSTIHISNSLQGMQNLRKPVTSEQFILSGNKMGSHVEAIGTCYLTLNSGFVLELQKTFYVPSFSRNLISVSRLVPFGYSFHFSETSFSLIYKSDCVGNGILSDGLYCIFLQNDIVHNSLHVQTGIKKCVVKEDFSTL